MGAGKDGFKIETKPMLKNKRKGDTKTSLLVKMEPKDRYVDSPDRV
jgi:hypothetical protein